MRIKRSLVIMFIFLLVQEYSMAQLADKVLKPDKVIGLLPKKIQNYHPKDQAKSSMMKIGTLTYSMAERTFVANNHRSIKILLFDFKEAPIMFDQAIRKKNLNTISTDSLLFQPTSFGKFVGWESYNQKSKTAQLLLGMHERFYLTITGEGVELATLRDIMPLFLQEKFPD